MWRARWAEDGWAIESGQYQRTRVGRTGRLPTWYVKRPLEVRGEEFYIRAYQRLSSERRAQSENGGLIPWSRVNEYGREYRLSTLMHEWFVDLMMVLDQAYMEKVEEDQAKKAKQDRKRQNSEDKSKRDYAGLGSKSKKPKGGW